MLTRDRVLVVGDLEGNLLVGANLDVVHEDDATG